MTWRLRGTTLPGGESEELWIADGEFVAGPVAGADVLREDGWIMPGLVDAHCHIGIGLEGPVDYSEALEQARIERDAGVLLIRDAGVPIDTRPMDERHDLPRIVRAGRHLAAPKRYVPKLGLQLEDESLLPDAVAEQAQAGDGWVKLVGDWIDRSVGDLAPLWSDAILKEAIDTAHRHGARVTAHVFGEDALPGLLNAGIDCLEHGTGLRGDTIAQMARQGTALVPTMINIENFPSIADSATRYPTYAAHMRALYARHPQTVRDVLDAGVAVYAGTDAGGMIRHGRIVDEVAALAAAGLGGEGALAAASWSAREWLLGPGSGLAVGKRADFTVYAADPRTDPAVLRRPELIVLCGEVVGGEMAGGAATAGRLG